MRRGGSRAGCAETGSGDCCTPPAATGTHLYPDRRWSTGFSRRVSVRRRVARRRIESLNPLVGGVCNRVRLRELAIPVTRRPTDVGHHGNVQTGTDVAIETSDLTIVSGDLRAVADTIAPSRRTLAAIKGNLFCVFAYKTAAIPLAALGVLNPMIAAGAMGFSSVLVVTNSLRLHRFDGYRRPPATHNMDLDGPR